MRDEAITVQRNVLSMKIGIMTWWHNTNYGGFLQGLATHEFLRRNGIDAELVDFAFPRVPNNPLYLFCSPWFNKVRHAIIRPVQLLVSFLIDGYSVARLRRLWKTHRLFYRIRNRVSPMYFKDLKAINDSRRYDAILVGSDQTWTPYWQDKEFSYLLGGLNPNVRRLSYAASVAAPTVHPHEEVYREALGKFDAISVREKSIIPELEKLSGKPIKWVVDPTLLLSADEWKSLLHLTDFANERHICVYWLSPFDANIRKAVKFAKKRGLKVHLFTDIQAFRVGLNPKTWLSHLVLRAYLVFSPTISFRMAANAHEFIQDLSTAEYVLSDSFHALMFSIIFNRKIKLWIPFSRRNISSRIEDFLSAIGGSGIVTSTLRSDDEGEPINEVGEVKLANWVRMSKDWLLKMLSITISGKSKKQ